MYKTKNEGNGHSMTKEIPRLELQIAREARGQMENSGVVEFRQKTIFATELPME